MEEPTRPRTSRRRRTAIILLAISIFLLFTVVFSQQAFDLYFLRPSTSELTLVFAAVSALIFLVLVALTFVLIRTLLKLFAERRGGVIGSQFRSKMVLGALILSFGPVIFLFLFAYGLMNRSIDKWFSRPVEEVRQDTEAVSEMLSRYAYENAEAEAISIALSPEAQRGFETGNFGLLMNVFRRREPSLQHGFVAAIVDGEAEAMFHAPETWPALKQQMGLNARGAKVPRSFSLNGTEYILATHPVGNTGSVLVGLPLPASFSQTVARIEASQQRYLELARQRKLIRRTYMGLLLLLTVLVLFAATWFALFLSKFVTRPVAALAEATEEISRGHLDYRVQVKSGDEFGRLILSFNRMAEEMESSRRQIEASSRELGEANMAVEQRRRQMETILESIPTGVLSLDAEGRISHTNTAMQRIFRYEFSGTSAAVFSSGSRLRDCLPSEVADELERLMRKARRLGNTTAQMEIALQRQTMNVAVTVAALEHEGQPLGYVLVFEDLSDLLKGQKQAAWREVARRVAHEIKNPLTPIALSAERIRRHLERGRPPDEASLAVINECAGTIAGAVEIVRTLVDEFSTLARFPTAQPQPSDINAIVESVLAMFNGRLDGINVRTLLAADLPKVMADPDAMKRAIANLVDNAAESMQQSLLREVQITTALLSNREGVEIVVADTGEGITRDVKEKLFLPYFSTKKRGTGLGLAIVSRIVEDHHGSIRVEENKPVGARFIVELPVAAAEALSGAQAGVHA